MPTKYPYRVSLKFYGKDEYYYFFAVDDVRANEAVGTTLCNQLEFFAGPENGWKLIYKDETAR